MIKQSTPNATSWAIMDTEREPYNDGVMSVAYADLPQAGDAGSMTVDFLSNGFKIRENGTTNNTSGSTYIYAAFAEAPFKYANAR